jgi:hypothetical protein
LFLYFGAGNCSVVELDPADKRTVVRNATTGEYVTPIFRASAIAPVLALASGRRRRTAFMNGPSIREIDGRFWLSYWAVGGGRFFGMYHAVAEHPLGPFRPVGPLLSLGNAWKNTPARPTDRLGNTHGGMFEPRSRPGRSRRPSIVLREDPRGTEDESGRRTLQVVSNTHHGASIGFKYLDFGPDHVLHTVLVELDARSAGRIGVYVDAPHTGPRIATVRVPPSAVGAGWRTVEATTAPVAGSHALFMVFEPDRGQLGDLSLFAFRPEVAS